MPQIKKPDFVKFTTKVPAALLEKVDLILHDPYTGMPQHGARQRIVITAFEEFVAKHDPSKILSLLEEN